MLPLRPCAAHPPAAAQRQRWGHVGLTQFSPAVREGSLVVAQRCKCGKRSWKLCNSSILFL